MKYQQSKPHMVEGHQGQGSRNWLFLLLAILCVLPYFYSLYVRGGEFTGSHEEWHRLYWDLQLLWMHYELLATILLSFYVRGFFARGVIFGLIPTFVFDLIGGWLDFNGIYVYWLTNIGDTLKPWITITTLLFSIILSYLYQRFKG